MFWGTREENGTFVEETWQDVSFVLPNTEYCLPAQWITMTTNQKGHNPDRFVLICVCFMDDLALDVWIFTPCHHHD
jgi:hypothetical protein